MDDVLAFLASESQVSSVLGGQLERLEQGCGFELGMWDHEREWRMLNHARLIRCVDGLQKVSRVSWIAVPGIKSFATTLGIGEGELVVRLLRAYQPWASYSEERALAAVYEWMRSCDGSLPEIDHVTQAFRNNKAKRARARAVGMIRQAMLVLTPWIERYNGRKVSSYAQAG